jgi:hypothetical protein
MTSIINLSGDQRCCQPGIQFLRSTSEIGGWGRMILEGSQYPDEIQGYVALIRINTMTIAIFR